MKKKIFIILIIILLMVGVFFLGRQVGLNTEQSNTQIVTTQEKVSTQSIKKTLTSSGSVSSKTTEKLELKLILILIIILGILCFCLFSSFEDSNNTEEYTQSQYTQTKQNRDSNSTTLQEEESTETLSSKSEVKSALIENVELHTTYYLEEVYVEENSYVAKGENILKYTNGTYLTAPYDCYIVELNVPDEEGKALNSHYVQIQSKNILTVSMKIDEKNINKVKVGDKAQITVSAIDKTFEGYITHIGSTASNGKFTIDIEFENDGNVKIGMTSTILLKI